MLRRLGRFASPGTCGAFRIKNAIHMVFHNVPVCSGKGQWDPRWDHKPKASMKAFVGV